MNTPAHLIFGMAVFGRPGAAGVTAAALTGAILPDLSLYLLGGWHLLVLGTSPEVVFGQLYYGESWQAVFRIDNSAVLWGIALGLAMIGRSRWGIALCGAALLHLALDLPLHNDDARAHFWPLTQWTFISPVSYWDPDHFGAIMAPLEAALTGLAAVMIWRRFSETWVRLLTVVLVVLQIVPLMAVAAMAM